MSVSLPPWHGGEAEGFGCRGQKGPLRSECVCVCVWGIGLVPRSKYVHVYVCMCVCGTRSVPRSKYVHMHVCTRACVYVWHRLSS